uniref:Serpin domain-containing protein n=1 Tax=Salix viminalis TaxID=40686 RepID=A0A6N2LZG2_SALVM
MDFCMHLASEVIINEIKENPNNNFVMSPLSLYCLLNMLNFLESENVADINEKSSRIVRLATMNEEPSRTEENLCNKLQIFQNGPPIPYICLGKRCQELSFLGFKILKLLSEQLSIFSIYTFLPVKLDGLQELVQNFNSDQSMLIEKNLKLQVVKLSTIKRGGYRSCCCLCSYNGWRCKTTLPLL